MAGRPLSAGAPTLAPTAAVAPCAIARLPLAGEASWGTGADADEYGVLQLSYQGMVRASGGVAPGDCRRTQRRLSGRLLHGDQVCWPLVPLPQWPATAYVVR
jgi:hypothetical protein